MSAYVKENGNLKIKVWLAPSSKGTVVGRASLWIDGRDVFILGYIMGDKSWLGSGCFSGYDETKRMLPMLQEMLDIFDDGEFTDRELKLLGYKVSN